MSHPRILSLITSQQNSPLIEANLSGTITRETWPFGIHEDSKVESDELTMEHKVNTLDLSDESRTKARKDRGKENILPSPHGLTPAARDVQQSLAPCPSLL